LLQSRFLVALLAEFPYQALGPELAISAGIRAGFAVVQAFLAIADFHLLAFGVSVSILMKKAFHQKGPSFKTHRFVLSDTGVSTMKRTNKSRDKMQ